MNNSPSFLDRLRPHVLRALRIHGWVTEPSQVNDVFTVRARPEYAQDERTGKPRKSLAVLRFSERGVTTQEGHGGCDAVNDLRAEARMTPALAVVMREAGVL